MLREAVVVVFNVLLQTVVPWETVRSGDSKLDRPEYEAGVQKPNYDILNKDLEGDRYAICLLHSLTKAEKKGRI